MKFEAILFDCDGVLVDSERIGAEVTWQAACAQGYSATLEETVNRFRGWKMAEIVKEIESSIGKKLPAEFVPNARAEMAKAFQKDLKPIDGIFEALLAIPDPICITSGGPMEKIFGNLKITGLLHAIGDRLRDRIFSSYDVNIWKPDPGLFLHAAKKLGAQPSHCAVVEDSEVGVRAGVAAGMTVYHYTAESGRLDTIEKGTIVPFTDMRQLPGLLANG